MSWLDSFFKSLATRVQDHGSPVPYEQTINFTGTGVNVADDQANSRTTVTINGAASLNTASASLALPSGSNAYFAPVDGTFYSSTSGFGGSPSQASGPGSAGTDQLSLSIATTGGNLRVSYFMSFHAGGGAGNASTTGAIIFLDGTAVPATVAFAWSSGGVWEPLSNSYDITSVGAGVHTVSLRWACDTQGSYLPNAFGMSLNLFALELK